MARARLGLDEDGVKKEAAKLRTGERDRSAGTHGLALGPPNSSRSNLAACSLDVEFNLSRKSSHSERPTERAASHR